MILVDTSIWINHFRSGVSHLEDLLVNSQVACHPFIIGELACGNIKNRKEILSLLKFLPMSPVLEINEYLSFVDLHSLSGKGVGFVDVHILSSAKLADLLIWSSDKRLKSLSIELGIAYV